MDTSLREKLSSATSYLTFHHPFISVPLLRLDTHFDAAIPTACTDGRSLRINPDFFASLTPTQSIFLLAHVTLHIAHLHHVRKGARDDGWWNAACDYVVNDTLRAAGFDIVQDALLDSRFSGMSSEEVYEVLVREAREKEKEKENSEEQDEQDEDENGDEEESDSEEEEREGDSNEDEDSDEGDDNNEHEDTSDTSNDHDLPPAPSGFGGDVEQLRDPDTGADLTPAQISNEAAEMEIAAYQALQAEMIAGNGTVNLSAARRMVKAISPSFDAREELLEYAERCLGRDDYSWSRPNQRYFQSTGVYLPALSTSNDLQRIVVVVDTSGSIRDSHLTYMAGVLEDILTAFPSTSILVAYCDTDVRASEEFTIDSIPITLSNAAGGGGTRFQPAFDWVEVEANTIADGPPSLLIYLTDLQPSDTPRDPLTYPVCWLSTSKHAPSQSFGKRINLTLPAM